MKALQMTQVSCMLRITQPIRCFPSIIALVLFLPVLVSCTGNKEQTSYERELDDKKAQLMNFAIGYNATTDWCNLIVPERQRYSPLFSVDIQRSVSQLRQNPIAFCCGVSDIMRDKDQFRIKLFRDFMTTFLYEETPGDCFVEFQLYCDSVHVDKLLRNRNRLLSGIFVVAQIDTTFIRIDSRVDYSDSTEYSDEPHTGVFLEDAIVVGHLIDFEFLK